MEQAPKRYAVIHEGRLSPAVIRVDAQGEVTVEIERLEGGETQKPVSSVFEALWIVGDLLPQQEWDAEVRQGFDSVFPQKAPTNTGAM